jgi:ABC-type polysaccharide/polyol phosphate export systems, permease component
MKKNDGVLDIWKYRELLWLLVVKDIKVKYKRSIVGVLWSLLNPLFTMLILTVVFKELFRFSIENFAAYVISGQVIFSFFFESTSLAMTSIYTSGQLIKKVYVPKPIFPVSKILYSMVNTLYSIVAVVLVCLFTGVTITISILASLLTIFYLMVFCIGVGLILCSIAVFLRDVEHIYGVLLTAWMYATPIIYPAEIMPDRFLFVLYCNPLFYFVSHFREGLLYHQFPSIELNLYCLIYSFIALICGIYIFNKRKNQFVLYI